MKSRTPSRETSGTFGVAGSACLHQPLGGLPERRHPKRGVDRVGDGVEDAVQEASGAFGVIGSACLAERRSGEHERQEVVAVGRLLDGADAVQAIGVAGSACLPERRGNSPERRADRGRLSDRWR